jgi:ABC-type Fe3+ transport system substrate-binding protein
MKLVIAALFLGMMFLGSNPCAADWQGDWERTLKAAEKEGEVAFYTLGDSHNYVQEFQKKYPKIKVNLVPGRGSELLSRIMAERRGGKFLVDVARIGNTSPYTLYQAKALQPISSAFILPEVKDESKWWQRKHHYVDPEGKYIFVSVGSVSTNMVSYNTDLVNPAELKSYSDLLEPKWKGKIVVTDPRAGGYGRSGARAVYYHPSLGPDYLRRILGAMDVTLSRDYVQAINWLATKKFSLYLFGNGSDVLDARSKGLPVDILDTADWKEGAIVEPAAFTFVLMEKPAHPNAAALFVNWLLSKEGQAAIQREEGTNDSLRIDIPKEAVSPTVRRRDGARYVVSWNPQWMDGDPIRKLVDEVLGEVKKK